MHEHQYETSKTGMWLFLLQEVLFFSPLFVAFFVYASRYSQAFHEASQHLDWKLGAINTIFLISSSFTMARAVSSAQEGLQKQCVRYLLITLLFGLGFLCVKYFEYTHKFHIGIYTAGFFNQALIGTMFTHAEVPLFFSLYFGMTGLHGAHVLAGLVVMIWILRRATRGDFGPSYFTPVEMLGLYWHFVDLVWIYLFPMLYLVG